MKMQTKYNFIIETYDEDKDLFMQKELREKKEWESNLTKEFVNFLQKFEGNTIVIDVGAFIGWYSLVAASLNLPNVKIYSFEPYLLTFEIFVRNIVVNKFVNIVPLRYAVGDKISIKKIFPNIGPNIGDSRLYNFQDANYSKSENIMEINLDSFFGNEFKNFKNFENLILKIDTQGYDFNVLKGAVNLIKKFPNVLCLFEYYLDGIITNGGSKQAFLSLLKELKLSIKGIYTCDNSLLNLNFEDIHLENTGLEIQLILQKER